MIYDVWCSGAAESGAVSYVGFPNNSECRGWIHV